jgi:lipoprotein NlpD
MTPTRWLKLADATAMFATSARSISATQEILRPMTLYAQPDMNALPSFFSAGSPTGARLRTAASLVVLALVLAGCTSRSLTSAPVEDRSGSRARPGVVVATAPDAKPLPGIENAGKPGYYTIRPGDTLIRIGLDTGQNWRDISRWNNIENPNLIEVGQVLRVVPPANEIVVARPVVVAPPTVTALPAQGGSATGARAPTSAPVATNLPPASAPSAAAGTDVAIAPPAPAPVVPAPPAPAAGSDEDIGWIWPAQGTLVASFDEVKNKGVDIAGKPGDPVLASADGRVVYAGAGLRGYGNLVILKHNNTFLTAYAHNQALLVKEDQAVKRGQKIAEMGSTDADRVKLHFEIRRQGKPVDPSRYLPAR